LVVTGGEEETHNLSELLPIKDEEEKDNINILSHPFVLGLT
jgi:hypothetical protein